MFDLFDENSGSERRFKYLETEAVVTKEGPYNLWKIRLAKGPTPAELSGSFTTLYEAEKAINIRHERMSNARVK